MPRYLLLLISLLAYALNAQAKSHHVCSDSWRVGQRVVVVGDDIARAIRTIDQAPNFRWLRGPRGQNWTLVRDGHNAKTVQIKIHSGRLQQICQY